MACISVIIPVYNAERTIERCVNSICTQTYTDLEIILVNDGSQDKSGELCDTYAQKDNRIIVLRQINCFLLCRGTFLKYMGLGLFSFHQTVYDGTFLDIVDEICDELVYAVNGCLSGMFCLNDAAIHTLEMYWWTWSLPTRKGFDIFYRKMKF